jgi:hypothetical protein
VININENKARLIHKGNDIRKRSSNEMSTRIIILTRCITIRQTEQIIPYVKKQRGRFESIKLSTRRNKIRVKKIIVIANAIFQLNNNFWSCLIEIIHDGL